MSMPATTDDIEMDLRWYFGATKGAPVLERSVMGDMLDRAEQFSMTSAGERVLSDAQHTNAVWAHRQRECMRDLEILSFEEFTEMRTAIDALGLDAEDPSLDVELGAVTRSVSVRANDGALLRFSVISRSLSRCTRTQRQALESYYGPVGNRWLRNQLGRLLSLYELTDAGKAILDARCRRCRADGVSDEGGPAQRISDEWRHLQKWPDQLLRAKFKMAEREARKLLAESRAAFGGRA